MFTALEHLLQKGIKEKSPPPHSFRDIIAILRKCHALYNSCGKVFLNQDFLMAKLKITPKNTIVLPFKKTKHLDNITILKHDLNGASNGDVVLIKKIITKSKKRNQPLRGYVVTILKQTPSNKTSLAVLIKNKKNKQRIGIDLKTKKNIPLQASQKSLKLLPLGTILLVQNGKITKVLGNIDNPHIDEQISLLLYDKKEPFSPQTLKETQELSKKPFPKKRTDLSHLPFCTIDPIHAKDHDDAIYYDSENSLLYVAIADVSYYVLPNSSIDKEAKSRGFSIYFPHKSIPMLPRDLSENLCSLQANKKRLAMIWKMRLHRRNYNVLSAELFEGIIKVSQKISYEMLDNLLENKPHTIKSQIATYLQSLFSITQKIRTKRLQVGYDFETSEKQLSLNDNMEISKYHLEFSTPSHHLVEECMLLANKQSAITLASTHNGLGIYRVHNKPNIQKLNELFCSFYELGLLQQSIKIHKSNALKTEHFWDSIHKTILKAQKNAAKMGIKEEIDKLIIRSFQQANYSNTPIGHFGLGFNLYTHFTSPIRRYSDLIVHRLLKQSITLKARDLSLDCNLINQQEIEVAKIEKDFLNRKFARLALQFIGKNFNGIVLREDPCIAEITEQPLMGVRVFLREDREIYSKVKVKITEVDLALAKIYACIFISAKTPKKTNKIG